MRIRITDVDYAPPPDYGDPSLRDFGISVGDEFEVTFSNVYGHLVEHRGEELLIRDRECEVLED